jgi:hypothetical protein
MPFKGQREKEYLWYSAGASLPLLSLSSATAARRILRAAACRDAECTLTTGIRLLVIANALAPKLVSRLLSLQNRALPSFAGGSLEALRGMDVAAQSSSRWVHTLDDYGRANARQHDQYPGRLDSSLDAAAAEQGAVAPLDSLPTSSTLIRAVTTTSACVVPPVRGR